MVEKCLFTICSKNYLAQALTLKASAKKWVPDTDFYIFLADKKTEEIKDVECESLDSNWIPAWREMAFKYNVIEFNTAIKPFCFRKLFRQGYEKVVYLDPDTYVTDKLNYLWDNLEKYSIILTPHISCLNVDFNGAQSEESLLGVGIFNLGFCAMKNNTIGNNIADWWCVRLKDLCYDDGSLFVDQKWMNFIPAFYPNDLLVSHQFGLNVAVWNLHERELVVENERYFVKELHTGEKFPLLLFHFSGFDPFNDMVINRRHPKYGIDSFPSFKPIIQEYKNLEYKNGYDRFHNLTYSFNEYSNGYEILPLHRRLFRATLVEYGETDPFNEEAPLYRNLYESNLIVKEKNAGARYSDFILSENKLKYIRIFQICVKFIKRIFGVKFITKVLHSANSLCRLENYTFLMQDLKKMDKDKFFR